MIIGFEKCVDSEQISSGLHSYQGYRDCLEKWVAIHSLTNVQLETYWWVDQSFLTIRSYRLATKSLGVD